MTVRRGAVRNRMSYRTLAVACMIGWMLALGACGSGGGGSTGLGTPSLGAIPVPDGAERSGGPVTDGSTVTQSYQVSGSSVANLVSYYARELPGAGWQLASPASKTGSTDASVTWTKDDDQLLITLAGDTSTDGGEVTQLDLELTTG